MVITEYPAQIYEILYVELSEQQNHSFDNSIEKMTFGTMSYPGFYMISKKLLRLTFVWIRASKNHSSRCSPS